MGINAILPRLASSAYYSLLPRLRPRGYLGQRSAAIGGRRNLEWDASESVWGRQRPKLNALLEHAAEHVPYYRKLAEANKLPEKIQKAEDWAGMPILTKKIIRSHGGKIADKVTVDIDYVVLGAQPPKPPESTDNDPPQVRRARRDAGKAAEQYNAVKARAVDLHIPVMNTSRFVRDIGYANEHRLVYTN